jgi:DNA-binding transcriptional LysR family regulator
MQSWDDMRFFLAVAREGGLSGAAKTLGVEASTVHRRIGLLEQSLDAKLFDRHPRGYRLRDAGKELVEAAERMEGEVLAAQRKIIGRDAALSGSVRLATAEDIASSLLLPALVQFRELHPAIELTLVAANEMASLTRRDADIAVRVSAPPKEDDVIARRVCGIGLALYASEDYLETHKRPRRMSDIGKHDFVGASDDMPALQNLLKIHAPKCAYRTNSLAHMAKAVQAGLGISALPAFLAETTPGLVRLFRDPLPIQGSLWVLIHRDVRSTARVKSLADHLFAYLQGQRRKIESKAG